MLCVDVLLIKWIGESRVVTAGIAGSVSAVGRVVEQVRALYGVVFPILRETREPAADWYRHWWPHLGALSNRSAS